MWEHFFILFCFVFFSFKRNRMCEFLLQCRSFFFCYCVCQTHICSWAKQTWFVCIHSQVIRKRLYLNQKHVQKTERDKEMREGEKVSNTQTKSQNQSIQSKMFVNRNKLSTFIDQHCSECEVTLESDCSIQFNMNIIIINDSVVVVIVIYR